MNKPIINVTDVDMICASCIKCGFEIVTCEEMPQDEIWFEIDGKVIQKVKVVSKEVANGK